MNAKICKALRRDAKFRMGDVPISYHPIVSKRIKYVNPETKEETLIEKIKLVLSDCTRKVYKNLKKMEIKNGH